MSAFDAVPAELRTQPGPGWVVWRWNGDKKPPYCPHDLSRHASSTDSATWGTFEQAVALVEAGVVDGIGFALAPPFVGVDLDAELSLNEQYAIMLALDSYAEQSPSGCGHHVIVKASLNGHGRHPVGIGVFQTGRFFYCTGEHVTGTPTTIEERQNALEHVIAEYLPKPAAPSPQRAADFEPVDLDDKELLERAFAARNGDKFRDLWEGDWSAYPSQSEADLALLTHLAFWTDRDAIRMDALFRSSGLVRGKWTEREDYRTRSLDAAIEATPEGYRPRPSTPPSPRPSVTPLPAPSSSGEGRGQDPAHDPASEPISSPHSWLFVDIVARRANPPAPPEIAGLFYRGYNHLVSGESEALKSWLALCAAADELAAGRGVLWVDGDDMGSGAVLERLHLLGAPDDAISRLFAYVAPDEPLDEGKRQDVLDVIRARSCQLAVYDGFNPLLVLHGLNPDSGTDVERFYRLVDPIRKAGVAQVLTDNVVKAREARGAWAIGSERKKSKAEVHLGMTTLSPFIRGGTGRAKIAVHKDRAGHLVRPIHGLLTLTSDGDRCEWQIEPDQSHTPEGEFRPTKLMERVSRYLELRGEPVSRSKIVEDVTGNTDFIRVAIDCLIAEGHAEEIPGPRGARLVQLVRAFRESEDEA